MRFKHWRYPRFDKDGYTKYGWRCQYPENLVMGKNVDIGCFAYLNAKLGIIINEGVQIGSLCSLYSFSSIDGKNGKIVLEKNCKIGTHSTIMPNIIIGENSIIGAHSLVNKNIPANVIAYGNPIRVIKKIK